MQKRGYFSGFLTGGIMGAVLGLFFASRHKSNKLSSDVIMGSRARKVFKGISRGMIEMLRR